MGISRKHQGHNFIHSHSAVKVLKKRAKAAPMWPQRKMLWFKMEGLLLLFFLFFFFLISEEAGEREKHQ